MTTGGDQSGARRRFVAWLVLLVLTLYTIFIGGAWRGIYESNLRSLSLVVIAIVLAIWAIAAALRPDLRPSSRLMPAFGLATGALAVSALGSAFPRIGAEYVAWAIVLAGLYLLLVQILRSDFFRRRIGALCVLLSLSLGLMYLGVVLVDWVRWWTLVGTLAQPPLRPLSEGLTYGNPSAVMTLELLLVAPAIAHVGVDSKGARILVACLLAVVVAVVVLSGSRAGWLGLGIALLLLGVTWLGTGRVHIAAGDRLRATFAGWRLVTIVVVGILLIAVGAILLPGAIYRAGSGGEGLRATYFAVALRIFADHALTGAGPGTWTVLRASYTESSEPDFYIPHAHNIYLQTAAELGLLGLAVGCFAIVLVALMIRQGIRDPEAQRRRFAWAAAASSLYLGAHQLLDFYANMPAILFAFAIPVAYLDATAKPDLQWLPRRIGHKTPRRLLGATGTLGLALSVTFLWWSESNARPADRGTAALNAGDVASGLSLAKTAAASDPEIPAYRVTLGLALERAGDWPSALAAFEAAAIADDLPNAWLGAAAAQVRLGDVGGARLSLDRALRLGTQQPTIALDAGWLYLALGDEDAAIDSLAEAVWRLPMLAEDPAWLERPELEPVKERVVDAALRKAPLDTAWSLALAAGRSSEARGLINDLSLDQRILAEDVLVAWGDGGATEEAQLARYRSLVARASGRPLDEDVLVWCVRLAQHLGRYDEALRFREWVLIITGGSSPSAGTIRMTFEGVESPDPATVGTLASFYGHYTYRRPTPFDLTPPGLPRLVLVIGEEPSLP